MSRKANCFHINDGEHRSDKRKTLTDLVHVIYNLFRERNFSILFFSVLSSLLEFIKNNFHKTWPIQQDKKDDHLNRGVLVFNLCKKFYSQFGCAVKGAPSCWLVSSLSNWFLVFSYEKFRYTQIFFNSERRRSSTTQQINLIAVNWIVQWLIGFLDSLQWHSIRYPSRLHKHTHYLFLNQFTRNL